MTQHSTPLEEKQPERKSPSQSWKHIELYNRILDSIYSLPAYFSTKTTIEGVLATDIFTLGAALSATIEEQVVHTLNLMRDVWDPNNKYNEYSFIRRPQSFPDVIFASNNPSSSESIIMGIELKGWYILAKENEPSFRYCVTPNACETQDLLVVVPWALSNIVSGSPKVFTPFVEIAKYAAEYRNYHWKHIRNSTSEKGITSPIGAYPYPPSKTNISDKPVSDSGGNFGRVSRTGLMDEYNEKVRAENLLGIEATYWIQFFNAFKERGEKEDIEKDLSRLRERIIESRIDIELKEEIYATLRLVEKYLDTI